MLDLTVVKYFVSQLALFASFLIVFNIIMREKVLNTYIKTNIANYTLISSAFVLSIILFLDYMNHVPYNYYSITLIAFIYLLNIKVSRFFNNAILTLFIIFINSIVFDYQMLFSYKYLLLLIVTTIIPLLKLNISLNKRDIIFIFLGHLICFIEMIIFYPYHLLTFFLFVANYLLAIVLILLYLRYLFRRYRIYHDFAHRDYLTGLYNERMLYKYYHYVLKQIKNSDETYSFIFIDMNDLKTINDQYGHRFGDEALRNIAYIMSQIWEHEFVARKSGDEFCVICKGQNTELINKFIKHLLECRIEINEEKLLPISASIGSVIMNKENCHQNFMELADFAMYQNKKK